MTTALSSLSVLQGPERSDLLPPQTLAELFEATAARQPDHTALIFGDQRLTYGELNALADQAASKLIKQGIKAGQLVGLWMPRGIDLLVMQLAIAKTGAGWVPVDADTPVERLNVCLEDANASGLVSSHAMHEQLPAVQVPIWLSEHLSEPTDEPLERRSGSHPDQPAYVIYTSGSTGKPKGILISQQSIAHFLRSENDVLGITGEDRVYQGFSVAFDMSFEEIWISYLVGATLWIAPKAIASDPEQLPLALRDNHVTVLHAVPTLLALFEQDVPSLRIINLGGEMCPAALVDRWDAPNRKLFNTYGPTEATVSASLARLHAGQPITIGTPLPNYNLLVVDPNIENGLRLLPKGEVGELCISGPGVATGYLGRPDLTAEKFLANPWATGNQDDRLYRTGDLARIDDQGRVECLGRADDQVKIRGFRVELGEIEAVLADQLGVGTTAVLLRNDDGIDQLVAFVVPTAQDMVDIKAWRNALGQRLPAYMVPNRFEVLTEVPRLTSGKIDRKALKAMPLEVLEGTLDGDTPHTPAEEALFTALRQLFVGQPIYREADFFSDLGGHSLFAARLASLLRNDPRFAQMTVRDIYQHRTVGAIANVLGQSQALAQTGRTDWIPPSDLRRWVCGAAQAVSVPVLVAIRMMQWLAPFFTYHFFTGDPGDSVAFAVAISVVVFLVTVMMEFVIAIAGKWLVAGRLRAGRYPLWGLTYFRWWLADRLVEGAPTYLLSGSTLYSWWLRALGAKVGKEVQIGSLVARAPDLVRLGDYTSVGHAVYFENARVERGELILGPVAVEDNGYVGSYTVLEGNTAIEPWGHLESQSSLADGESVPAERIYLGSPVRDVGRFDPASLRPRVIASKLRALGESTFYTLGILLISMLFFLPVFPSFMLIDWLDDIPSILWQPHGIASQIAKYFLLALPASAILIACTMLLAVLIRWTVLPRLKPGSWSVHSGMYLRKWLVNQIQESSLQTLYGIYATVFSSLWYRMLGAKVGRGVEISTALGVVPDMLTLGDETFIADAVVLGDEEIDGGWLTMQPTVVGKRSFVGNGAYVPDGSVIPENVLIGVQSRTPANDQMKSGDTWLGSPPLHLPAREQAPQTFPESLTFRPSPLRRLARGLVEAFRIIAPTALVISVGYTLVLDVMPVAGSDHWGRVALDLTEAGLVFGLATFVFLALFKWIFVGRYRKRSVPMWTPFVWLSEATTSIYEGLTVPNFLRYLRGTPWLPVALRLLGVNIGRGVYMDTTDITEFDCVHIGDYSEINGSQTCPQTHLFEDRIMKVDDVRIGRKVYVGPRTTVLYSATVGDGARLGAYTLVMKGEQIPFNTAWRGSPAAPDASYHPATQPLLTEHAAPA